MMNPVQMWNAGYNAPGAMPYGGGYDPYSMGGYGMSPFGGMGMNPTMDRRYPMERTNAYFYEEHHKVDTAKKVGVLGFLGGAAAGATAGFFTAGPVGAAVGGIGGAIVGGIGGWLAGDKYGGDDAVHHDAHDNGVLDGSPLYHEMYGVNSHG